MKTHVLGRGRLAGSVRLSPARKSCSFFGVADAAETSAARDVPVFEVDSAWPKVPEKMEAGRRVQHRYRRPRQRLGPASPAHAAPPTRPR